MNKDQIVLLIIIRITHTFINNLSTTQVFDSTFSYAK